MADTKLNFPAPEWAVFNLHVNDAGKRALAIVSRLYGEKELAKLVELDKLGIMAIFDEYPLPDIYRTFAELCFVFANGLDVRPTSRKKGGKRNG